MVCLRSKLRNTLSMRVAASQILVDKSRTRESRMSIAEILRTKKITHLALAGLLRVRTKKATST